MLALVIRRLLQAAVSLLIISVLVFGAMFAAGDPVATLLPPTATREDKEILRRELGLDRPLAVQYGKFLSRAVRGDFGHSYHHGRPVLTLIKERIPATLELATVSMLMALAIGAPLGVLAAARPSNPLARAAMGGSLLGISLPTFWLGMILVIVFGVQLHWLPTLGRGETGRIGPFQTSLVTLDGWRHLILPAFTLSLHHIALLTRLTRSEMLGALRAPHIRVARAYGVAERDVVLRHALRNSLIPVVTVTGVEFGQLIAFSVVTETIFQWPGLGKLLIDSVYTDRPLVVAYLMMTGAIFMAINFAVDMTYALIDPRIRTGRMGETA